MVARIIEHPSGIGVIPTPYNPDPALLAIVEIIRTGLIRDQHIRLHKFGTFRLRWSKKRLVKHPKTGESIPVPPAPRVTFTPAKQLREWIEPDPKPVIPLDEPGKNITKLLPDNIALQNILVSLPSELSQNNKSNLRESVQNIIDDQYNPPDYVTDLVQSQTANHSAIQENNPPEQANKSHKKWALGLLSAVPFIIYILQSNITNENTGTQANISSVNQMESLIDSSQQQTLDSTILDDKIIRTGVVSSTTPGTDTQLIPVQAARSEPEPKSFYMSPQVHTIQHDETLWDLAKNYYGDALLWPHIYRANKRTLINPDKIYTGKKLVIPGLQQSPDALTYKDKELISEGYFLVYQYNKLKGTNQAIHFLIGATHYSYEWLKKNRSQIENKDWQFIIRRFNKPNTK